MRMEVGQRQTETESEQSETEDKTREQRDDEDEERGRINTENKTMDRLILRLTAEIKNSRFHCFMSRWRRKEKK